MSFDMSTGAAAGTTARLCGGSACARALRLAAYSALGVCTRTAELSSTDTSERPPARWSSGAGSHVPLRSSPPLRRSAPAPALPPPPPPLPVPLQRRLVPLPLPLQSPGDSGGLWSVGGGGASAGCLRSSDARCGVALPCAGRLLSGPLSMDCASERAMEASLCRSEPLSLSLSLSPPPLLLLRAADVRRRRSCSRRRCAKGLSAREESAIAPRQSGKRKEGRGGARQWWKDRVWKGREGE